MIFIVKVQDVASETGRITLVDTMAIVQGQDHQKPVISCKFLFVHLPSIKKNEKGVRVRSCKTDLKYT